jgi:hypothetical protein
VALKYRNFTSNFYADRYESEVFLLPSSFLASVFIYLWSWSGTNSTITVAIYWPTVSALDDRWWLESNYWNESVAGETQVLGENLTQCRSVHHRSHMTWPGIELGQPKWDNSINKMETAFSETSMNFYSAIWHHVPRHNTVWILLEAGKIRNYCSR